MKKRIGSSAMRIIVNIDVPNLAPATHFYNVAFGLHLNRLMEEDATELVHLAGCVALILNDEIPERGHIDVHPVVYGLSIELPPYRGNDRRTWHICRPCHDQARDQADARFQILPDSQKNPGRHRTHAHEP